MQINGELPTRRRFLQSTAALGLLHALRGIAPVYAQPGTVRPGSVIRVGGEQIADLVIARTPFGFGGRRGTAKTINGTVPGPLLRFLEGETVTLRVTNRLDELTAIHWHGVITPSDMDGVPGVSFPGIPRGETFTYRFRVRQNGTYWYHSHFILQEQQGNYAPIIIEPNGPDPVAYDREHVIVLADWTFRNPQSVLAKLKKQGDYFNFQQRTVGDFFHDASDHGLRAAWKDRAMWARMRMDSTDILDVTGNTYTYLVNGLPPDGNWTGLFQPGERVRLRFINSAAGTYFNVRIPGLPLTIVQADGQNVQPMTVDEFQIAIAETHDVIVRPGSQDAYTVFAESMDRSGYARGTLTVKEGLSAAVPALRARRPRSMSDMGMQMDMKEMPGMEQMESMPGMQPGQSMQSMPGIQHGESTQSKPGMQHGESTQSMLGMQHDESKQPMPGMEAMPPMKHGDEDMRNIAGANMEMMAAMRSPINGKHGPDMHGPENSMVATVQRNRLGEPGTGLAGVGHRVLVYTDLKALEPSRDPRKATREIEMHLTGNMQWFIWGIDGRRFSDSGPPPSIRVGERVRLTLVNDTMMDHPMHLHGVFMEVDNGADMAHQPRKHTINVKGGERLSVDFTYDEPGNFAFHCHILYHQELGMFRFLNVSGPASTGPVTGSSMQG